MEHEWTGREFKSIGRGDVSKLLDKVAAKSGARQADLTLAIFSSMANWYATREDDYRSPIVRGMKRGAAAGRGAILNDDELRAVGSGDRPAFWLCGPTDQEPHQWQQPYCASAI